MRKEEEKSMQYARERKIKSVQFVPAQFLEVALLHFNLDKYLK